jgi:hypothetical protein
VKPGGFSCSRYRPWFLGLLNPGLRAVLPSRPYPFRDRPLKSALSCIFKGWPMVSPIPSPKVQENWSWGQSTNPTWSGWRAYDWISSKIINISMLMILICRLCTNIQIY